MLGMGAFRESFFFSGVLILTLSLLYFLVVLYTSNILTHKSLLISYQKLFLTLYLAVIYSTIKCSKR